MMKFLELISEDEATAAKAELLIDAKTAALQVECDILAAEKEVANCEKNLAKTFKIKPYAPSASINAKRDLEDAQQTVIDLYALKNEYFTEQKTKVVNPSQKPNKNA